MITESLIENFFLYFPCASEEGNTSSSISVQQIRTNLATKLGNNHAQSIQAILNLVEHLLTTLSILDTEELQNGRWKFVSHPAQLCALSLLHTLADPRQKLLPSNFWQTAGIGDDEKRQQKRILQALEDHRRDYHLDGNAPPIRFIYVAWGIVKLGDKILFHQRESREHVNEYGLIGGRVNAVDLRKFMGELVGNHDLLRILQSPHAAEMLDAMQCALERELLEEAGIAAPEHYEAEIWRDLKPWQACMGAAPNYALTQYFFRLYHIRLTTAGYLTLNEQIEARNPHLIQCTLDEVVSGETQDRAKKLVIKAIYDDFSGDRDALRQGLEELPSSYENQYRFTDQKDALILSLDNNIRQGESGKECEVLSNLDPAEKSLLLGLATHAKGFDIDLCQPVSFRLRQHGWIAFDDGELRDRVTQLSEKLRRSGFLWIEFADQNHARLALSPNLIYLDPECFCFILNKNGDGWTYSIKRRLIRTNLGDVLSDTRNGSLANTLAIQIQTLEKEDFFTLKDQGLPKKFRSALQDVYQSLGLRILLTTKNGYYRLSIEFQDLTS